VLVILQAQQTADPAVDVAKQYEAAYNKADGKAIAALYTADAIRITTGGQLLLGRPAIEKSYVGSFANPHRGTRVITIRVGRSTALKPEVVVSEGTFEITGASQPVRGRFLNTIVRDGGEWRMASIANVPDTPAK
jgi:uncharacterized protein (TIGR02246 family)